MTEFIKNAWLGWLNYSNNGKLAALLLIALMVFWFARKEGWSKYSRLFLYTTVMSVCCICPLTAAAFMLYQTKFYDYQWIWGFVPITIVVALAYTLLWSELTGKYEKQNHAGWKKVGITVLMLCTLYLCGRMGKVIWDADEQAWNQQGTAKVLEIITENGQNTNVTLWAPQGIMEYARALDGNICLPYGRNMWDPALNAYSYETYGEAEDALYAWMSHAEETGEGEVVLEEFDAEKPETVTRSRTVTGTECVELAAELGVNHILLPEKLQPEVLAELEEHLGLRAEMIEGYYWFRIDGESGNDSKR